MSEEKDHRVSRRQFLTYSLMGTGAFMAAGMIMPMARFALDPALKAKAEADKVYVCEVAELNEEPQKFTFKFDQVDAWYESEKTGEAYIFTHGDEIIAMSPKCTHLGCTVGFDTNPEHPNQFFCPCHFGLFDKEGINIPGTPPTRPLDVYDVFVEDGKVYLGQIHKRT